MKNILQKILLLTIGIIMFSFCSSNVDTQHRLDIEKAKKLNWYNLFLVDLTAENKIDSLDAVMFKSLSSDLNTNAVTPADIIVKRFGKLKETDIKKLYNIVENENNIIYIITQGNIFNHLFKYNPSENKLEIIKNKNSIVYSGDEELFLTNNNDSTMTFSAQQKNDTENKKDIIKYYVYNKIHKTFCHYSNCKTVDNKEDCEYIKVK